MAGPEERRAVSSNGGNGGATSGGGAPSPSPAPAAPGPTRTPSPFAAARTGPLAGPARPAGLTPPPFPAGGAAGLGSTSGQTPRPFAAAPGPGDAGVDAVREALRSKVERVPLSALERRGFKNVQILDMAAIERIVAEAVTHCVERHSAVMSVEDREKVQAEAHEEFRKLLAEHKKLSAEKTEAERRREELERQMQGLRAELQRQQKSLATEQARSIEEGTFSISPAAFADMEERIRRLFQRLVSDERRASLAEAGPGALRGLTQLEREVAALLDRLLVGERDRFMGTLKRESSEKIAVLERRIEKLNRALAESEEAMRALAAAKSVDGGIASIYKDVQGLRESDLYFARKRELLAEIFGQNIILARPKRTRRQVLAEERRAAREATAGAAAAVEGALASAARAKTDSGAFSTVPPAPPSATQASAPEPARRDAEAPRFGWALPSRGGAAPALDFEPPLETTTEEKAY